MSASPSSLERSQALASLEGKLVASILLHVLCITIPHAFIFLFAGGWWLVPFILVNIPCVITIVAVATLGGAQTLEEATLDESTTENQQEGVEQSAPVVVQEVSEKQSPPASIGTDASGNQQSLLPEDWEQWLGRNVLQKLGMVVVLCGMMFFLWYSIEEGWLNEVVRLVFCTLAAAGLLGIGEYFSSRLPDWSRAFTGGGLALLYFTVWAADVLFETALAREYGIHLSSSLALLLYSGITAVGVLASLRYESQVIAWFGLLGGYVTPLLLTDVLSAPVLVGYLVVLGAAVLWLSARTRWIYLVFAAFACTNLHLLHHLYDPLLAMYITDGVADARTWARIGACVSFVLFSLPGLLGRLKDDENERQLDVLLIILNGIAALVGMCIGLTPNAYEYLGVVSIVFAALYALLATLLTRRPQYDPWVLTTYATGAVGLSALALYIELEPEWVSVAWALYSVLLIVAAQHWRSTHLSYAAYALLCGAVLFLPTNIDSLLYSPDALPFFSPWALKSYAVLASLCGWMYCLRVHTGLPPAAQQTGLQGVLLLLLLNVWGHITLEIMHLGPYLGWSSVSVTRFLHAWWIASGAVLCFMGYLWHYALRIVGATLLAVTFAADLSSILSHQDTLFEVGVWTGVALMGLCVGAAKEQRLIPVCLTGLGILAAVDLIQHAGVQAGLLQSIWWAIVAFILIAQGFYAHAVLPRRMGVLLFLVLVLKLLLFDFASLSAIIRIGATILTGLLMIGASYIYQRFDSSSS